MRERDTFTPIFDAFLGDSHDDHNAARTHRSFVTPQLSAAITFTPLQQQRVSWETRDPLCNNNTACVARTVVLRLFAFLSVTYTREAKICNREASHDFYIPVQYYIQTSYSDDKYVAKYYCWFKLFLVCLFRFRYSSLSLKIVFLLSMNMKERWAIPWKVENKREWHKMSRECRQENQVLTYEGNICKRII